jgi:hypothetical protein
MSGETARQESGWTVDTLKEHLESLLYEQRTAMEAAFAASEKAILKAENATERRFESVNEFRAQLAEQTTSFMPREVIEPRLAAVEKWQAKIVGALALVTIILPVLVAFAVYLLTRTSIPVVE